jgi:hypothetical protein
LTALFEISFATFQHSHFYISPLFVPTQNIQTISIFLQMKENRLSIGNRAAVITAQRARYKKANLAAQPM